jgi:predicted Zn-dependent protease
MSTSRAGVGGRSRAGYLYHGAASPAASAPPSAPHEGIAEAAGRVYEEKEENPPVSPSYPTAALPRVTLLGLLMGLFGPTLCASAQHRSSPLLKTAAPGGGWNLYSLQKESELGRQMVAQIEPLLPVFSDPTLQGYLQKLTDRIADESDSPFPVHVVVVESNAINGFVLPGGYLFLSTGLLLQTRSEAELAGIIAHEMGHIAARHVTRLLTRQKIWDWIGFSTLLVAGPGVFTAEQTLNTVFPIELVHFTQTAEKEADRLGLEYVYAAGYDPMGMVAFLERMHTEEFSVGGLLACPFLTHPLSPERVALAEKWIERQLPARDHYLVNTSDYDTARQRLLRRLQDETPIVPLLPQTRSGLKSKRARRDGQEVHP